MICVIVFTSIRGDVGQDTSNYFMMYYDIEPYKEYLESGFFYLVRASNFIGLEFNGFLLVVSIFSVSMYFLGISKLVPRKYVILSFLIIFCDLYIYFNISGMRQGIALSICLFSTFFAYRRNIFYFLLWVFFASLFHKSALIFILVYPLLKIKLSYGYKQLLIITVGCLVFFFISKKLLLGSDSLSFIKGGAMYLSEGYNVFSLDAYIIGIIRRFYPIFLFLYFHRKFKSDYILTSSFNVYFFGFLIYAVNYPILQDVTVRFSSYFIMFEAIVVIRILMNLNHQINKIAILGIIFFIVYFKIFTYSSLDAYEYELMDGFL
ncbi:EpsG family protein [Vibrio splendidus]|nr:EpsG family protein [Vibrio splendidus]